MEQDCVFCKIAKGEIKSLKIAENSSAFAFLDVNPAVKGHTLIIPKKHFESVFEVSKEDLKQTMLLVKEIAGKLRKNLKADGVNILSSNGKAAQQEVMHLHFHLIPRLKNDSINVWEFKKGLEKAKATEELAEKLRK